jgi:hypothetical protein
LTERSEFSVGKSDKIIICAHAMFEGIGIAGLIAAAFWYTTAPIAPDGFKGPISTYTITVTTIISLFLAIPIAYYAYQKLVTDINSLYEHLSAEVREFINSHNEVLYTLLKLRNLLKSDSEFKKQIYHVLEPDDFVLINSLILLVCELFTELEDIEFYINWQTPIKLEISRHSSNDLVNKVSFKNILETHELSSNNSIRKALSHFINKHYLESDVTFEMVVSEVKPLNKRSGLLRNIVFGTASGIACAEVLLSIGWSVASILIGIKSIAPVSNFAWACYAISSLFAGILFGVGMGFSRHKQKQNQQLQLGLKDRNKLLWNNREQLNNLITEKCFWQQSTSSDLEMTS